MACAPLWSSAAHARNDPLSAIDWLSQSVATPVGSTVSGRSWSGEATPFPRTTLPTEPPVASGGALPSDVSTSTLDGPAPDAVGLIAPAVSGLPKNLWGAGRTDEIARSLVRNRMESLPQLRQLFLTLLLAEADPPVDHSGKGLLLQARVDKLLQIGALEQAAALLEVAGATSSAALFRRSFDVALLIGNEDRACTRLMEAPGLAPTLQARVFCLARAGEWDAAALTLSTAGALGEVNRDQAALLSHFLDPELFEGEPVPEPPNPVTPLDWKIYEAVGETLPTAALPVAFAYAEISPNAGWKSQIEAAERLTRAGTIGPNVIASLYTQRDPAASGGVWERVSSFQNFDNALRRGQPAAIAPRLAQVWARMQEAELEVPFAMLYSRALSEIAFDSTQADQALAQSISWKIGLLSPDFASFAPLLAQSSTESDRFLGGLALGQIEGLRAPDSMGRAIAPAFTTPLLSREGTALLDENRLGEALLQAIDEIARGVEGNLSGITQGLSLLRAIGLETVARRTALELMILERRG